MNTKPIIQCKGITRDYVMGDVTVRALRGIDLEIPAGEIVTILGPSGSGKSTAFNMIGGLDRPTSGEVIVDGEDVTYYSESQLTDLRRRKFGFVFQFFNLIPSLTASENVQFALNLRHKHGNLKKRAVELLDMVGLKERADHFPSEMSGGQQQRVSIARALANRPAILMCDEPTGSLDTQTSQEVLQVIKDFNTQEGTTVVLITHEMAIPPMADRVLHIVDGKVARSEINDTPVAIPNLDW